MCGGGAFKRILDTGGLNMGSFKTALNPLDFGAGLTQLQKNFGLAPPDAPELPGMGAQAPDQASSAAEAASAAAAASARERRRAAARFGRASTIGAGTVGAPAMAGKQAIGS